MQTQSFHRSKYNICWISVLVIFVGTIIYPISFERADKKSHTPVVQSVTPTFSFPTVEVTPIRNYPTTVKTETIKPVTSSKLIFTRDLKIGDKGPDVKKLQQYLNQRGFIVATSGNGSPGQESELFGPGTQNALKRFQESYAEILLKPYGLSEGTGFFGEVTRKFVNS